MKRVEGASRWPVILVVTMVLVYLYTFMEWVFFVTKPSFMSGMSLAAQVEILLLSALGLSVLPLGAVLTLGVLDRAVRRPAISPILTGLAVAIPSGIAASLIVLLVDNFTYTVFEFGIVSTERLARAGYSLAFVVLCGFMYLRIRRYVWHRSTRKHPVQRPAAAAATGLLGLSIVLSLGSLSTRPLETAPIAAGETGRARLPNIILLGSDGLDANQLSVYGYERETTPNIARYAADALVIENAFPNGGTTAGSIASLLSGKLPLETGVIYPPDILQGQHSYQHLPGILQRLGYHTVDLSVPYFGDARTLNMQGGFDIASEGSGEDSFLVALTRAVGGGDSAYFVEVMSRRLADRLLHIFFIKPMINPIQAVIEPAERATEQRRFDRLISVLDDSDGPVFVHVHMLGTHGPRFEVRQQVFSEGQAQDRDWMRDFYDDAILSFDRYVGELLDYLGATGRLDDTVLVVYSDHGMAWRVHQRVPLIFWFPGGEFRGRIAGNVQNVDIAPTLLDYLDLTVPAWMSGRSLLDADRTPPAAIFSASVASDLTGVTGEGLWAVEAERRSPPFYQLGYVGLVTCDRWYELYVQKPRLRYGEVRGHTHPCEEAAALSPEEAREALLGHLLQNGYDVSSFPAAVPIEHIP